MQTLQFLLIVIITLGISAILSHFTGSDVEEVFLMAMGANLFMRVIRIEYLLNNHPKK